MSEEKRNVPKLRFPGFTDPWEQRKLGELFYERTHRSSDRDILSVSISNGIYPASESDRDTNPGASIKNYKIVNTNDIVYNSMRLWQGAVGCSKYEGIVSPAYVVVSPKTGVDSPLFGYLLKLPVMLHRFANYSQGNSKDTLTLKFDKFAEIRVVIPVDIAEQKALSAFFQKLDNLITLHQRKLNHLKDMKKGLLQQMFV